MTDQSPGTGTEAAAPRFAGPPRGRHAIPRTPALTRLRLPFGKALALTALPTALILGSQRLPAADPSETVAHSASDEAPGGPGTHGVDCARPDGASAAASRPPAGPTPSAAPSTPTTHPSGEPVKPPEPAADESAVLPRTPTATPTPSPSATSLITGLADILGAPLHHDADRQGPASGPSPAPSSATAVPKATAPSDPRSPSSDASSALSHRTAEPSPPPESSHGTARACDISDLKAPEDTTAGRFAAEPWNMKGSHLDLHDVVFHGVVTVDTAAGPKRVLKFTAAAVRIRDLKMAVPVGPQIQHIDGAPRSTSTLGGDDITMYVESLTGTLSSVESIPTPPLLRLRLTPDTVPEWLYDTIGKLGPKLQLGLDDADIDQAGQTGGKLVVPGIHGYGTPR